MIPIIEIQLEQPYFVRVKRNGKLAIATCYGQPGNIDRVKATDPNCFTQLVADYDWIQPVEIPTVVFDALSTCRINEATKG